MGQWAWFLHPDIGWRNGKGDLKNFRKGGAENIPSHLDHRIVKQLHLVTDTVSQLDVLHFDRDSKKGWWWFGRSW